MPELTLQLPSLRPLQYDLYDDMQRFNCWVCHRRFGKTVLSLEILIAKACSCQEIRPRYAYVSPLYRQSKQIAWDVLKAFVVDIPGVGINEAELRVDLPGDARIQLFGGDNYNAMRGMYFDGVVLDEYAQMNPSAWTEVIRPQLSDRLGWAIFIGTPYGPNHFYTLYQKALEDEAWSTCYLPASITGVVPESELEAARIQQGDEEYAQEFECDWQASLPGAYYADEFRQIHQDGRIRSVPYDPSLPTYTGWDLGINDTNAIWIFQPTPDEVRFIDYVEGNSRALTWWIEVLREKPYNYDHSLLPQPTTKDKHEIHYGPHDLENRNYQTGKTSYGVALEHGFHFTVLPHPGKGGWQDGITTARKLLGRSIFDSVKCEQGINALQSYRRKWDEDNKVYSKKPLHDWASNGADAFRYVAVGLMPSGEPLVVKPVDTPGTFDWMGKQVDRAARGLKPQGYKV